MNEIDFKNNEQAIEEITLLLIALTSWKEKITGIDVTRAWKGYDFDMLNALTEKGYISGSKRSKLVILTDEGLKKANELIKKYLGQEN